MQNQHGNQEIDFNFYFKQDILKLFTAYHQLNTYRFSEFVELWNKSKFYQIFS
jgi:hypothetical protein